MKRLSLVPLACSLLWTLGLLEAHAQTATVTETLTWTAPTQNTDKSVITLPLTYNVYQGTTTGAFTRIVTGLKDLKTIVTSLSAGNCFSVTAVDSDGESAPSQQICIKAPNAPNGLSVQVTVTIH